MVRGPTLWKEEKVRVPDPFPSKTTARGIPAAYGPAPLKPRPRALALAAVLKRVRQSRPGGA